MAPVAAATPASTKRRRVRTATVFTARDRIIIVERFNANKTEGIIVTVKRMRRRSLLKRIGGTATALALATPTAVAQEGEVARTIDLDAPGHADFDGATVTLYEDGRTKARMSGTRPANPRQAKGYRVVLKGLRNAAGEYVPEQAQAEIRALPPSEFVGKDRSGTGQDDGLSGSGSSGDSGVGTTGHGGNDGQSDYEGGIWVRSEDSADVDLTYTEGWIDWTTSGGEVDYVQWKWHATACSPGAADWNIDDAGHSYSDFSGDDVEVKFYGDYYDYATGDDSERTNSYHRLYATGHPNGSMSWDTIHWHTGEAADSHSFDAGYFSQYDQHAAGHC
jgi:hypothetical protein